MADLDSLETRVSRDWEALYWWRRDAAAGEAPEAGQQRLLLAVLPDAAPPLPGNRLRANREARRIAAAQSEARGALAPSVEAAFVATIRRERRKAGFAVAAGLVATAAPAAAAVYAAGSQEGVALAFALAGLCSAAFALYHAMRWLLAMRSDEIARFLV